MNIFGKQYQGEDLPESLKALYNQPNKDHSGAYFYDFFDQCVMEGLKEGFKKARERVEKDP